MDDDFSSKGFEQKTEWSMDLATLQRIHALLLECIHYSSEDNYSGLYKVLINLYKEALPYLKTKGFEQLPKIKSQLDKEYNNYYKAADQYNSFTEKDKKQFGFFYRGNLPDLLFQFECDLRLLLDKNGLLMKKVEGYGGLT